MPHSRDRAHDLQSSFFSLPLLAAGKDWSFQGAISGVAGSDGITVSADNVTIDLKGFSVLGVAGAGSGILAGGRRNVTVRNGTLQSWGSSGIFASSANDCQYRDLQVIGNTGRGIYAGQRCLVSHCAASSNTLERLCSCEKRR